jgi:hypothetical protein
VICDNTLPLLLRTVPRPPAPSCTLEHLSPPLYLPTLLPS